MLDAIKRWWSQQERSREIPLTLPVPKTPRKRKKKKPKKGPTAKSRGLNPTKFQGRWDQLVLHRKMHGLPVSGYTREVLRKRVKELT